MKQLSLLESPRARPRRKLMMENRRRLLDPQLNTIPLVTQMWRDGIRRNQVRLLRLRAWRATGVEPGRG